MKHAPPSATEETDWLTKPAALAKLGKSERSLDRLVAAGKVQRKTRQRDGRTPEPLYHRADIDRLNVVVAFPLEDAKQLARRSETPAAPQGLAMLADFARALRVLASEPQTAPPETAKAWLTVDAAAGHSGLSATMLRRLIGGGELPALRDGRSWKIRREDLDAIRAPASDDRAIRATPASVARKRRHKKP